MLPRRTRERVFEPAFYDLLRGWLLSGRRGWFAGQVLAVFCGSVFVGVRSAITRRRLVVTSVIVLALAILMIVLLRSWLAELYGASSRYR